MPSVFNRGLLLTSVAVVVGLSTTSAVAAARPVEAPAATSSSSALAFGTCNVLWDLLNAGGRNGPVAVGLTDDQRLIKFAVNRPQRACTIGAISLPGISPLIGIDYRVQDGKLYGVSTTGAIYTLSTTTAVPTFVSQLTVALSGASFGVDFNPAADRLRIVSDLGQNLRHNVNPAGTTVADSALTYPPTVAPTAGVTGAAYTNNDLSPITGTTLFDIDTSFDQVAVQSPANSGLLAGTGQLGVNATLRAGFDIYSGLRDGRAVSNNAYAVLNGTGLSRVYKIDPLSGEAQTTGAFGTNFLVTDLALQLNQ